MNLALTPLFLVFLLLPGFILVFCYKSDRAYTDSRAQETQEADANLDQTSTRDIVAALIAAPVLHWLWCWLTFLLSEFSAPGVRPVDYELVANLLAGDTSNLARAMVGALESSNHVTAYFLSLYTFTAWSGTTARKCVAATSAYLKLPFLLRRSNWFYLFSGRRLTGRMADLTVVSVTVELADRAYIYFGTLHSYSLDKRELVHIVLAEASRREIRNDANVSDRDGGRDPSNNSESYYPVRGDLLVVDYTSVKTLNIDYLYVEEVEEEVEVEDVGAGAS